MKTKIFSYKFAELIPRKTFLKRLTENGLEIREYEFLDEGFLNSSDLFLQVEKKVKEKLSKYNL